MSDECVLCAHTSHDSYQWWSPKALNLIRLTVVQRCKAVCLWFDTIGHVERAQG